jgi:PucR family transcriptional regulator, proline-responsive transcriptional activator
MSLRVLDWYTSVRQDEVSLLAGEAGLENPVCRVHVVEKPSFSAFLEGSEIIFTTGVAMEQPGELVDIIKDCYKVGVSAAVVNLGGYIKKMPPEVVTFCNEVGLPLFTVPWHIRIENLMQKVFQMIYEESKAQSTLEDAVRTAIQHPEQQEDYISALRSGGFASEWRYCVALAQAESDTVAADLLSTARHYCQDKGMTALPSLLGQTLVVLFANYAAEDVETRMQGLCSHLQTALSLPELPFYAVGRCTKSARCIQKSYLLADKILTLQLRGQLPEDLHTYSRLGIYKIVITLENQDVLSEIHEEYLKPLLTYDQTCGTDYLEFIQNYLKYDGRVHDIAEKMFIHRNTVHYKIRKVEEILDCDLQSTETKLYLLIATMNYQLRPA